MQRVTGGIVRYVFRRHLFLLIVCLRCASSILWQGSTQQAREKPPKPSLVPCVC